MSRMRDGILREVDGFHLVQGVGFYKLQMTSAFGLTVSLLPAPNVSLTANLFQMRAVYGCQSCRPAVCVTQVLNMNHSRARAAFQSSVSSCCLR